VTRAERIREAVTAGATDLLRTPAPEQSIPKVLQRVGMAAAVNRIQICEGTTHPDGRHRLVLRYEWHGVAPREDCNGVLAVPVLSTKPRVLRMRTARQPLRDALARSGTASLLLIPIFRDGKWWGQIGFAQSGQSPAWSAAETKTLELLADMVGAALASADRIRALSDANRIVENSPVVLFRIAAEPPHPLVYLSRNVSRFGYTASKLMASPARYFNLFHPGDRAAVLASVRRIASGAVEEVSEERRLRTRSGRYVWVEVRARRIAAPKRTLGPIEGILIDIDDRIRARKELARYSQTDPVTGLANRKAFVEELERMLHLARRDGTGFAVHYVDLDRFKDVNDVLGHRKGDELLKAVGRRLAGLRRTGTDLVGRLGDDEFALLQTAVAEPSDAGAFAGEILDVISRPFDLGPEIHVTASVGISLSSPGMRSAEDLLKPADVALNRAKETGRNQFHFHSEALDAETIERVTLGGELRHALERGELRLAYQPQVDAETGRIVGAEALARWHHPRRGVIEPARFISIAEKTGIIVSLGQWVVEEACRQVAAWRSDGLHPPPIAINISAEQLKSAGFTAHLLGALEKWRLDSGAIELELTETVLMETTRQHREVIENLRVRGIALSIDDFGTGYSSLAYLRAYHVNHLKIAQAFVEDIRADSGDIAIVRAAVSLGRELGISVIAEGVQTELQYALVREAGCRYVQGFIYSPPLPPEEAAAQIRVGSLNRTDDTRA
jgi:diguanylate cyclase (GGDEF)-like protein/PAS domain S-box-containing protein